MAEDIDLRKSLEALARRWKWIVVLGVSAAVTAAIASFFFDPAHLSGYSACRDHPSALSVTL